MYDNHSRSFQKVMLSMLMTFSSDTVKVVTIVVQNRPTQLTRTMKPDEARTVDFDHLRVHQTVTFSFTRRQVLIDTAHKTQVHMCCILPRYAHNPL